MKERPGFKFLSILCCLIDVVVLLPVFCSVCSQQGQTDHHEGKMIPLDNGKTLVRVISKSRVVPLIGIGLPGRLEASRTFSCHNSSMGFGLFNVKVGQR